jgi:hypothetical protein
VCKSCTEGSGGDLRVRYFDDWSSWPVGTGLFTTGCTGNCVTE